MLKNLNLWQHLKEKSSIIRQVHVSRRGHFGAVRLKPEDGGLPYLGYVIPAFELESVLNEELTELPNVTFYRPAVLQTLTQDDNQVTVSLRIDEKEIAIQAGIVIGADGTLSTVRQQLNITSHTLDYGQSAIVTRICLVRAHASIAYERFYEKGAIAILPLGERECAAIWTADNQTIQDLIAASEGEFIAALQQIFGYRVGRMAGISERYCFSLHGVKAEKNVVGRVLLLGNAAHTLHPIAAQGLNLALYEVAVLVERILEKQSRQAGISALDLQEIDDKTRTQRTLSVNVSHRLAQLFSYEAPWVDCGLQVGMIGLNHVMPLKRYFIKKMVGRTGRVPSLMLSTQES